MTNLRDEARWLIGEIGEAKRLSKAVGKPQLANSAIEAGRIEEYDADGVLMQIVGEQHDGTHAPVTVNGPVPPEPVAPVITVGASGVEARWSGKFTGDMFSPMDFSHVALHASRVEVFTPSNETQLATITGELGDVATKILDAGEWTFGLVAVSKAGKWSDMSETVTLDVPDFSGGTEGVLDALLGLGSAVDGKITVNIKAPALADGEGKPVDALWNELDPVTREQVAVWRWTGLVWENLPLSETIIPKINIAEGIYGRLRGVNLEADAIDGKTITGANIIGSRYQFNGAGAGDKYNFIIDNDGAGAYAAWEIPSQVLPATIRAFESDPWSDYSTPTLTIRPPSVAGYTQRGGIKISAGATGGTGGLVDIIGNIWARGELRGRYQDENDIGRWASLAINDVTSNYTGESPSIKSLGMYNRTYTYASNMYITSNGYVGRATSIRESKLVIEDIPKEQIEALLDVNPRWWFDKGDSERLAEYLKALEEGEVPEDLKDVPNDLTRIPGLVAEEVEEAGATAFVTYNRDELGNKKLSGVNYDRVGPALIPLVREQRDKIRDLEARLEALEARFQ